MASPSLVSRYAASSSERRAILIDMQRADEQHGCAGGAEEICDHGTDGEIDAISQRRRFALHRVLAEHVDGERAAHRALRVRELRERAAGDLAQVDDRVC